MTSDLLEHFKVQWAFVRGLTQDLLESLSDDDLMVTPDPHLGSWWKQFRHVGRVQENYLAAIETGSIRFGIEGSSYFGGPSKANLLSYLATLDTKLAKCVASKGDSRIDWFGEQKSLGQHLMYLADHEVLHHGQWIVYRKLRGSNFPQSWAVWGL